MRSVGILHTAGRDLKRKTVGHEKFARRKTYPIDAVFGVLQ
jgi:hypothetical protein